jgi:hypothetical protein
MTDRVIHAQDLDGLRGLAEDGKAYAKIDDVTIKFNTSGQMVAQVPTTTTAAADPTVPGAMDGDEWLVLTNGVITKQWVWDVETSSWYARPVGGGGVTTKHEYDTISATAGLTSHTLPSVPELGSTGKVAVYRNGRYIGGAWTWNGAVGTYDPAKNYGCTIDAGDKLEFDWEAAI